MHVHEETDNDKIIEICKEEYKRKYGIPLDRVVFAPSLPSRLPLLPINDHVLVWHTLRDSFCAPLRLILSRLAGFKDRYDYYDDIPIYRCKKLGCFYFEMIIGDQNYRLRSGYPRIPIEEFLPSIGFSPRHDATIRLAIVMDPLVRFSRFYNERVVLHQIYKDESAEATIDHLETRIDNDDFARPQSYFLGSDSSYYTHIFRYDETDKITALMSELSGISISFPTLPQIEDEEKVKFTQKMKKQIKTLYKDDYAAFGKYFD